MPFLLFRHGVDKPSVLTENDARRILANDFPGEPLQGKAWSKLVKGERVFVRPGQLQWVRDDELPKGPRADG